MRNLIIFNSYIRQLLGCMYYYYTDSFNLNSYLRYVITSILLMKRFKEVTTQLIRNTEFKHRLADTKMCATCTISHLMPES